MRWFYNFLISFFLLFASYNLLAQNITTTIGSVSGACVGDTASVTITHSTLTGVANASLRMTYNPDSLTYVGYNMLNPAFNSMTIQWGNGSVLMDWNTSSNQTISSGNLVNLRFLVNGNSNITWDTVQFPCEFSDINFNVIPQTYVSGSITQNTQRLNWSRNICEGQSFALGYQSYSTSGIYQGRLLGFGSECDTLISLNLNVIPRQINVPSDTICSNVPYFFNNLSLTASGTYYDTLINSLGCDSILQLKLFVNQAYSQNQNFSICRGTTFPFGGQILAIQGSYSHTYTTLNRCDSVVQLNLIVLDSVSISSTNNINGFCPGGSLRIGLVSPTPNVTYQWTKDGSIITGANSDSLLVTQSGVYRLIVQVSPTCSVASNPLPISVLNCNRITGDLKYDNNNQTPLTGVPVHLKTLLGNIVASDTTDSAGVYDMTGYNNGNYVLDANVNYVPGGINSTDALQVSRFFTSLISLSPLRVKAGDVNGNNITNSADALLINRRITGLLSAFSVGSFVNSLPSITASGNPLMANLRVLSTGDVNGTYNPLPLAPALVLDTVYGNGNVGTAVVRFTTAGSGVFESGIVWSSSPNPTISSSKSVAGSGGFGFTHSFSSIDPNNIQYARAYARTSVGVYYSNERSFTPIPGLRCPGTPSVTDIDGNVYNTVQIGNQCWTQSNLKTSRYRNGDSIPTGLSNSAWGTSTSGAYAIYNNDPVNDGLYGKLYNYYAVTDSRGLCPTGWHVPSMVEWSTLSSYLGGSIDAGGALKSTAMQPTPGGWNSPNTGATNSSGFSALGGDMFPPWSPGLQSVGYFWTSSFAYPGNALASILGDQSQNLFWLGRNLFYGFSVRCIKSTLPQIITNSVVLSSNHVIVTGELLTSADQRGFCYSTTPNPSILNDTVISNLGSGTYSDTISGLNLLNVYYFKAFATNILGTAYGNEISFNMSDSTMGIPCSSISSVTDIDGNIYQTVQIGTQCWLRSDLKVTKYRNGDSILSYSCNGVSSAGAFRNYNNQNVNNGFKIYNYYAVDDDRGLCPTGWHVPSNQEWNTLVYFLDQNSDTTTSYLSVNAGGALKSTATQPTPRAWNSPNIGATNSSGFSGLQGPWQNKGNWWTSSPQSNSEAWYLSLSSENRIVNRAGYNKNEYFSVRCLKDTLVVNGLVTLPKVTTLPVHQIHPTSAIVRGNVTSDGGSPVIVRGVAYGKTLNPTVFGDMKSIGVGLGTYTITLDNLIPKTLYYVRSYATNMVGISYGNQVAFMTPDSPKSSPCPGTPTVTDIDGNIYQTVQIESQCWTASNLKVSKYANGDPILFALCDNFSDSSTIGAYSVYNNDQVNDAIFGKLYNHYAVTDSRGLCPSGWHVPSDSAWTALEVFCGGDSIAGGHLKSKDIQPATGGWSSPNTGASNYFGFNAQPLGVFDRGNWWTSTITPDDGGWGRQIRSGFKNISKANPYRYVKYSVRCLKDTVYTSGLATLPILTTLPANPIHVTSATTGGNITSDGGSPIIVRGVAYGTTHNPTIQGLKTINGSDTGVFTSTLVGLNYATTYYIRSYATNYVGTSYGNEVSLMINKFCPGIPSVTDIDNNVYNTVRIGTQCWMQSNLKVSKYRNGDAIPTGLSDIDWGSTSSGAYAIYNNNPINNEVYGKLYNYQAVFDSRGLCPTGWHVPTEDEWRILLDFVGPSKSGDLLRSVNFWSTPNIGLTDVFGFSALPGGARFTSGGFSAIGSEGVWRSYNSMNSFVSNSLYLGPSGNFAFSGFPISGHSVRCLLDSNFNFGFTVPVVSTISAYSISQTSVTTGGNILSDGGSPVIDRGVLYGFNRDLRLDNRLISNGVGSNQFLNNLSELLPGNKYYLRSFASSVFGTGYSDIDSFVTLSPLPPKPCPRDSLVIDIDGNVYQAIQIGSQCWTQSNLKTSRYRNGDSIPTGLNNSAWQNTTAGAYAIYNNDTVNDGLFGKLYNNYAVTDSRGLCPTGWHVPSQAEWTLLENQFRGSSGAGGALKSIATQPTAGGWNWPNTGATNSSGFTALPGGRLSKSGNFSDMSTNGYWWPSSGSLRKLNSNNGNFDQLYNSPANGAAVRCVKDGGITTNIEGGIVFYVDSTGQHGLVCAPSDQGIFEWGCFGTDIVGTSTAFGTGQANTNLILSGCSTRPIAASVCDDLVLNGYSDWYLPSVEELQLMFSNLRAIGIGGFSNNNPYWSSSQANPNAAWSIFNGSVGNLNKGGSTRVRAVRAF